jgi:hypothetical protein
MVGVVQQRPNQLAAGECILVNKTITGHGWTDFFHDVTCQTRSNCEPTNDNGALYVDRKA